MFGVIYIISLYIFGFVLSHFGSKVDWSVSDENALKSVIVIYQRTWLIGYIHEIEMGFSSTHSHTIQCERFPFE